MIFPERSAAITGRQAIERYWTLGPGQRVTLHEVTPARIEVDGRHAYDHGRRKELPQGWRIHLDMWNSGADQGP